MHGALHGTVHGLAGSGRRSAPSIPSSRVLAPPPDRALPQPTLARPWRCQALIDRYLLGTPCAAVVGVPSAAKAKAITAEGEALKAAQAAIVA